MPQSQPYAIKIAHTDSDIDPEEFLTSVVECAGDDYDSADIDAAKVVTLEGAVAYPVHLARIIMDIRFTYWRKVTITGGIIR